MATRRKTSLLLGLLVFLSCIKTTQWDDIHPLSCIIIVKTHTTTQKPQCEVQCSLDGVPFLRYDNDNKGTPLDDLGKAVHATQMCTDLVRGLESLGQELRKRLADTKQ